METGEPVLLRLMPGDEEQVEESDAVDGTVIVERNPCLSGGALEIFLEPQLPSARVLSSATRRSPARSKILPGRSDYDVVVADADERRTRSRATRPSWSPHTATGEERCSRSAHAGVPYVALVASTGPRRRGSRGVGGTRRAPSTATHARRVDSVRGRRPRSRSRSWPSWWPSIMRRPRPRGHRSSCGLHRRTDPVCGIEVAVSDATPHLDTPGGRVYFCCAGCRDTYAKQLAGDVGAR